LAERLQRAGHAVIVPDLRGHGRTTRRGLAGRPVEMLDRDAFRAEDFRDMQFDIEAAKSHLLQENNAGELNIDLLCLVGFDLGAVVGLNWVRYDWSVPPLPTLKQGQDVKAFVLVSPEQSFRGLPLQPALEDRVVRGELSAMVIFGQQQSNAATAGRRIFNTLKRSHREIPTDPGERQRLQDLFLVELDTSLQGTKVLTSTALKVPERIEEFIQWRLVDRADQYPWQDRSLP
jgi:pimeloyl-ACP methyl ester carboxylesterase